MQPIIDSITNQFSEPKNKLRSVKKIVQESFQEYIVSIFPELDLSEVAI